MMRLIRSDNPDWSHFLRKVEKLKKQYRETRFNDTISNGKRGTGLC